MVRKKINKRTERNLKTRARLWPDLNDKKVWSWRESDGFVNIPRTMPYFFKIMDECSKSKPLSTTFFALWCRCWDESGIVKINNPAILSGESGFSGQRAVTTWRIRMRILEKLGFIKTKAYGSEEHGYVVLLNPYKVVKSLYQNGTFKEEGWFNALYDRAEDIKATDLEDDDE